MLNSLEDSTTLCLCLSSTGLVVDLTNTSRWYDAKTLSEKDIKYVKINCKGRAETPNEDQTRTFIQVCSNFIAQNPLLCIGVHCTHGFNRTGFLIAAYLVEKHDWGVDAAVQVCLCETLIISDDINQPVNHSSFETIQN